MTNETEITADVTDQLSLVRESGAANMMSTRDVRMIAVVMEHTDLVRFIDEINDLSQQQRAERWMAALNKMVERNHANDGDD